MSEGTTYIRGICAVKGCNKQTESKGIQNDRQSFKKWCASHRRPGKGTNEYKTMDVSKCSKCRAQVKSERHRTGVLGRKYVAQNVAILCPPCHKEAHVNKLPIPIVGAV